MLLAACEQGGSTETVSNDQLVVDQPEQAEVMFASDHLLQIDIEMDPNDYEQLRHQGRGIDDLYARCSQDFSYSYFNSKVTIDGTSLESVGVRKKGFFGSLSANRPSLKLKFDYQFPGRRFEGLERLTLNNNRNDASATHQCITYDLFRKAGLVAPRCNFARVTVNGRDLGIYSNVESIDDLFLQRNFSNAGGTLYEAQLAEFDTDLKQYFQTKTNEQIDERSEIEGIINALAADDENLLSLLDQVLDIEQFIDFWALEIITGHGDSATGLGNNYFLYANAEDQRLTHIPWGTDEALSSEVKALAGNFPIWHNSALAQRLYSMPDVRQQLFTRLESLLAHIYDVDEIHQEIDRIQQMTNSSVQAADTTKRFVANQKELIHQAMGGDLVESNRNVADLIPSCEVLSYYTIDGEFEGENGSFSYTTPSGEQVSITGSLAHVESARLYNPPVQAFTIVGDGNDNTVNLQFTIEEPGFKPGETQFHGSATALTLQDPSMPGFLGQSTQGFIEFDDTSDMEHYMRGRFEANLIYQDFSGNQASN